MLGKEEEYKNYLAMAKGGNQDLFEDAYAYKKSEQYGSYGIRPSELMLVRMKNYLDLGSYKVVYDSLKSDLKKIEGRENKALANLYLAEAALNLKKYNETVNICDQLTEDNYSNEKWIVPMADLLNAKAKFFSGDRTGAKDHLEDA